MTMVSKGIIAICNIKQKAEFGIHIFQLQEACYNFLVEPVENAFQNSVNFLFGQIVLHPGTINPAFIAVSSFNAPLVLPTPTNVMVYNVSQSDVAVRWSMQYVTPSLLFKAKYFSPSLPDSNRLLMSPCGDVAAIQLQAGPIQGALIQEECCNPIQWFCMTGASPVLGKLPLLETFVVDSGQLVEMELRKRALKSELKRTKMDDFW
eukprot:Em0011g1175a